MRRLVLVLVLAFLLTGCISQTLTTPTTPLTYAWVMAHSPDPGGRAWGVQIGPKVDGSGSHVAVYAWTDCPVSGACGWEFFREYQVVTPGSVHDYAITWTANGWVLSADGVAIVTLNVGTPNGAVYESASEHTTS